MPQSDHIVIEVFCAPSCQRCGRAWQMAQDIVNDQLLKARTTLRKLNVVDEIDYAVKLGIRSTPAIVIDGELVFTSTPDAAVLDAAIRKRL